MPGFEIGFEGDPWVDEDGPWQKVLITLGESSEGECADLSHWSAQDYEQQWFSELVSIAAERDRGALIVCLHDPSYGESMMSWTMWRKGEDVLFQNQILFMLEDCPDFDPARVWEHVGDYRSHSDEGVRISEWTVPLSAIREFVGQGC